MTCSHLLNLVKLTPLHIVDICVTCWHFWNKIFITQTKFMLKLTACIYTHTYIYTHVRTYLHPHNYVCSYMYVHACMYVCVCVWMCLCVCVCICIYYVCQLVYQVYSLRAGGSNVTINKAKHLHSHSKSCMHKLTA